MTIDTYFISFMSISLAAVFLALVIGARGAEIKKMAATVSNEAGLLPARRKERIEQVQRKTEIADEAMRARARGERYVPPKDYRKTR